MDNNFVFNLVVYFHSIVCYFSWHCIPLLFKTSLHCGANCCRVTTSCPRRLSQCHMSKYHHMPRTTNSKWKPVSLLGENRLLVWKWHLNWDKELKTVKKWKSLQYLKISNADECGSKIQIYTCSYFKYLTYFIYIYKVLKHLPA